MEGALLSPLFLLLILQLLGYTDVILHKLVLLDIGGVVLLDYRSEKGNVRRSYQNRHGEFTFAFNTLISQTSNILQRSGRLCCLGHTRGRF